LVGCGVMVDWIEEELMSDDRVTVLVPTFNRSDLLIEAIESLLNQDKRPDEIIVINDGSTDDTLRQLEKYADSIRILSQKNQGKSTALNLGLAHASHGLIWIFDDDDLADPAALGTLHGLLRANKRVDIAYGRHKRFYRTPDGKVINSGTGYWTDCGPEMFFVSTLEDMFAHQAGMLVRKSLFDRVGIFNTSLVRSQDYEMSLRLAKVGTVVSTNAVIFYQRIHDGVRGTKKRQFSHGESTSSWREYDKVIFERLYRELPLSAYLERNSGLSGISAGRQALLRRAGVMARKQLWGFALSDLDAATKGSQADLTSIEIQILRNMFASKYGCSELLEDDDLVAAICRHVGAGPQYGRFGIEVATGLRWRVRRELLDRHFKSAFGYFSAMVRIYYAANGARMSKWPPRKKVAGSMLKKG